MTERDDDAVQRLVLIGRACGDSKRQIAALSSEEAARLGGLQEEIQDLSVFLRGLAHRLHPPQLDRGGLRSALQALHEELERGYGLRISLELPAAETPLGLSPQRELALFRIAQEALHNVVRHAKAGAAEVRLSNDGEATELTISDRGQGFDSSMPASQEGIGLISIRERAYLAEGEVEISSVPGQGTTVRARLPHSGVG